MEKDFQSSFTLSPDQKGIETPNDCCPIWDSEFTLSPDQKGIETGASRHHVLIHHVHTEPRSKGD